MEGFMIGGWEFIFPGCGGISALTRGVTLAARWLHEPQPISSYPVWLGVPHLRGGIDPGDPRSSPRVVGVIDVWKDL